MKTPRRRDCGVLKTLIKEFLDALHRGSQIIPSPSSPPLEGGEILDTSSRRLSGLRGSSFKINNKWSCILST
jgi:hypothetical protein